MEPDEAIDGFNDVDGVDEADEPRRRGRRSWLFSGRPPSSATVGVGACVYGAISAVWGGSGPLSDLAELWQESPSPYLALLGVISATVSLFVYATLRVALPLVRPRVTKRWRSEPLVMRSASLAQAIIFFRTLELVPAFMIGTGCGMLLTLAAGTAGFDVSTPAPVLFLLATAHVSTGLVGAIAKRQAEASGYRTLLRIR